MKIIIYKLLKRVFLIFNGNYSDRLNKINVEIEVPESVKYTIGITTFDKRFDKYFKPLIESIYRFRNDIEVVVMINAPYQKKMDSEYKKEMLLFLSRFPNVYPHFCTEFRSLSKLWNNELIFSSNNYVLILNDDVTLLPDFFSDLDKLIIVNKFKSFKINGSWSHVFLNRHEINEIGWFDERLLGVGEEDGDMEFRWCKYFNEVFNSYSSLNILNHIDNTSDSSIVKHSESKYSKFNRDFIKTKYIVDFIKGEIYGMNEFPVVKVKTDFKQYCYEKFYWENKDNL